MDKRLKYFCTKCGMGITKKEIKRHKKLDHQVIQINPKPKSNKVNFQDFKNDVLEELQK